MTIKTNFTTGSYNAVDLVNQFGALFTDGVCSGGTVTAHSPANLSVDVAPAKTMKSGLFMNSDAVVNVAIGANTSGYNRIDVIACDLDNNNIVAVQGTPSSSPTAPILTNNKLALYQVLVGNNVSVIDQANITDVRINVDLPNSQKLLDLNGYQRMASGLVFQWGYIMGVPPLTITGYSFPTAFTTACYSVLLACGAGGSQAAFGLQAMDINGFQAYNPDSSVHNCYWFAVGK
jgi:hypothetical protein